MEKHDEVHNIASVILLLVYNKRIILLQNGLTIISNMIKNKENNIYKIKDVLQNGAILVKRGYFVSDIKIILHQSPPPPLLLPFIRMQANYNLSDAEYRLYQQRISQMDMSKLIGFAEINELLSIKRILELSTNSKIIIPEYKLH